MILTLSGADVRARSVGIDYWTCRGCYRFFSWIFPSKMKCPQLRWGEIMATLMTISASQNTTLVMPLWRWQCIWQTDCSFSLRAVLMLTGKRASQMCGTFSPLWREQRDNLKQLFWRDCSWCISFYLTMSGWIFNIIGWLFSHTEVHTTVTFFLF